MKTLRSECIKDTLLIQISEADVCLEAWVGRRCLKKIIRNITTNREEIAWIETLLALADQIAEARYLARTLAEDYSLQFGVEGDVIEPRLGGVLEQLETLKASLERERSQGPSRGSKTYPHPARATYRGPATNQDESSGASTEADLFGNSRGSSLPDQCEARRR